MTSTRDLSLAAKEIFLPPGNRSSDTFGADRSGSVYRSIVVIINVTSGAAGNVDVRVEGKDANGAYYTIIQSLTISGVSQTKLIVCPGAPSTPNVSANEPLPETWRVVAEHHNANLLNYSIGLMLQT